jgi:2-polyprenyl-6-methoxyphenol hydroxylase-like FAD-dependent oxidoreductase
MLRSFQSWGPGPLRTLEKAAEDDLKVWELMDMENLDSWTDESLVLIGDAAHPFLPCKSP